MKVGDIVKFTRGKHTTYARVMALAGAKVVLDVTGVRVRVARGKVEVIK